MKKNNLSRLLGWSMFFLLLVALFTFVSSTLSIANAGTDGSDNQQQATSNASVTELAFDGVTMYVSGAHQEGEHFQVDVCFSLPDERDWLLTSRQHDAILNVNGRAHTVIEEGILDIKFNSDNRATEKCRSLLFPVKVEDGANLTLSLKKIYVSEPEKVDCPALQKQLDDEKSEIEVSCPTEAYVGGFSVIQKSESMDNETAYEFAHDILTDARRAGWEFHFKFPLP
jgi:hypothetical protein